MPGIESPTREVITYTDKVIGIVAHPQYNEYGFTLAIGLATHYTKGPHQLAPGDRVRITITKEPNDAIPR